MNFFSQRRFRAFPSLCHQVYVLSSFLHFFTRYKIYRSYVTEVRALPQFIVVIASSHCLWVDGTLLLLLHLIASMVQKFFEIFLRIQSLHEFAEQRRHNVAVVIGVVIYSSICLLFRGMTWLRYSLQPTIVRLKCISIHQSYECFFI